jgi:hypothetical protein
MRDQSASALQDGRFARRHERHWVPAFKNSCSTRLQVRIKDIDQVMENAKELVEIKYTFKQFVNVKGN